MVLYIFELWFLALLVLLLHRLSPRLGLAPLLVFLGGLAAALQYQSLGSIQVVTGDQVFSLTRGSFLILPTLLLGLLVTYIINGTSQARAALFAILVISLVVAFSSAILPVEVDLPGLQVRSEADSEISAFVNLASAFSLLTDMTVLIVVYQTVYNMRQRFPSRLAAGLALLAAAWTDAILFPLLTFSLPGNLAGLGLHLAGKTLAVLAVWPLLFLYLSAAPRIFPDTAALSPRPALDLFSTTLQLEARARYHYRLLQILRQIDQLIVRTNDPQTLLNQACQLLSSHGDYLPVWIGLVRTEDPRLRRVAYSGVGILNLETSRSGSEKDTFLSGPAEKAINTGQAAVDNDLFQQESGETWKQVALERGSRALAAFPMRHQGTVLGVLTVYARRVNAFAPDEINLLQELSDELAYALISLEARRQQVTLHTSAEMMQDGLLIMDLKGQMVYANPSLAEIVGKSPQELEGQFFFDLFSPGGRRQQIQEHFQELLTHGKVSFDLEQRSPDGRPAYFSVGATVIRDIDDSYAYAVVNVRNVTHRRVHERRLLTLQSFTTELVQAHHLPDLLQKLFLAGEELLLADAEAIYLLDPQNPEIRETYSYRLPKKLVACLALDQPANPVTRAIKTQQPVPVENIRDDPALLTEVGCLVNGDMQAFLALPIVFTGRLMGVLILAYREPRAFNPEELHLGGTLAQTIAIAIQNARYATELEQRVKERTVELSTAKERIEGILGAVPEAVFVLDEQGSLVQSNPTGDALLVQAEQQGVDLFTPDFLSAVQDGDPPDEEKILEVGGRAYQALASPLQVEDQPMGLVVVFHDVTRFQELDQVKSQFVSDVSHELRTPLTNLSLYIDLLSRTTDPDKIPGYVATVRRETERLTFLIEDLLTISRLEAGRVDFHIDRLNINRLVSDLVEDREPMATSRNLELQCLCDAHLPDAWADSRLLTQVLSNLLTNALNYTPAPGKICIYCDFVQDGQSAWVRISVEDTGVGIHPDELPYLFERFFRGSASRATGAPGTGLGLSISKEIADRLDGRITVDSQPGKGTTFMVWLPAVL